MKFDMRKEGFEARIDEVDDDDEHEGLDDREAHEEESGSKKQCVKMIFVIQASTRSSSTR